MLASRICVLDYWKRVPGVDDGHGEPGEFEPVSALRNILQTPILSLQLFLLPYLSGDVSTMCIPWICKAAWHGMSLCGSPAAMAF